MGSEMCIRDSPSLVSNMWHFPIISVKKNARAELRSSLNKSTTLRGTAKVQFQEMRSVRHTVTYREITILPFRISLNTLPRIRGAKQTPLNKVSRLMVSNLTRKVAQAVSAHSASG